MLFFQIKQYNFHKGLALIFYVHLGGWNMFDHERDFSFDFGHRLDHDMDFGFNFQLELSQDQI